MQWQHRSPAYRCRPGRAASLRGNGPAGRVWRAVRRVAVPAPCRAGPQAPVRLRIRRKLGLYFRLRPLLRRAGLWAGLAVFVPLLLFAQQFVWYADTSSLTTGQAARARAPSGGGASSPVRL